MPSLPPPRLITTSHNENGKAIFSSDTTMTPFHPFGPKATGFTVFHSSPSIPVSNEGTYHPQVTATIPRPSPNGSLFCISDFPPGWSAPMHRTLTVDYTCVISGSIWCLLDGGEERQVRAGEMMLQRGTNYLWTNRGDEPCRVLVVMLGSEPVKLADGTILEATRLGPPKK